MTTDNYDITELLGSARSSIDTDAHMAMLRAPHGRGRGCRSSRRRLPHAQHAGRHIAPRRNSCRSRPRRIRARRHRRGARAQGALCRTSTPPQAATRPAILVELSPHCTHSPARDRLQARGALPGRRGCRPHQNAVRAVGTACTTSPLPLVIPCRRVVRSDGTTGGPEVKRWLRVMEGAT